MDLECFRRNLCHSLEYSQAKFARRGEHSKSGCTNEEVKGLVLIRDGPIVQQKMEAVENIRGQNLE